MGNIIKLTSEIIDSNGVLNAEVFNKVFFDGLWTGVSMWFDSPMKILAWIALIALIVLSYVVKIKMRKKRMRQMARYQAEEMRRIRMEYDTDDDEY